MLYCVNTVGSLHRLLAVSAVIAALLASMAAPAIAAQLQAPPCPVQRHECRQELKIRPCCCDDHGNASDQGGPVESRVRVTADLSSAPADDPQDTYLTSARSANARVHTSPPNLYLLDLPTLFACLLL